MDRRGVRWCALTLLAAAWSAQAETAVMRLGTAPTAGPSKKAGVPRRKPPTAYVVKVDKALKLDGKLDEPAWREVRVLHLTRTLNGAGKAAQPTEVRLLLAGKTLHVGVKAVEPMIGKLQAAGRGRDGPIWDDDSIEIFLGTGGAYWHFGVNAAGGIYDARAKDASWNSPFRAAVDRAKAAWTVEAAIPLTAMAAGDELPEEWIANFNRNRRVTGSLQEASWSPTYSGDSHVPSRFGKLLLKPPPEGPDEAPAAPAVKKEALEVLPAANGMGVARFDLSRLPDGAKVRRADLRIFRTARVDGRMDQAAIAIEVYPLTAAFKKGGKAPARIKPLAIRPPWYDRLDATEAVRAWCGGKTNGGFFVKTCPFWNAEATCLDVWYEGTPGDVPKQVAGVEAVHHAGQTFITWREINDPIGRDDPTWGQVKRVLGNLDRGGRLRYCVFRHRRPISAANLHEAELIATAKPLSGWNVNGRALDRGIDRYIATADHLWVGHWSPWWQGELDGKYGTDCPIDRLVIPSGSPARRAGGKVGAGMRSVKLSLNPKLVGGPLSAGDRVDVWDGPVAAVRAARLLSVEGDKDAREAVKANAVTIEVAEGQAESIVDRAKRSRHGLGLTVRPKGARPLPRDRGLYVHTAGAKGKAYYAVCTSLDGVINTRDVSPANSLSRPVTETVGTGEPVCQKQLPKMPFFNYDQKRLHYVRWVSPPMVNVPSQYYNWSVAVPHEHGKTMPLELNFHRDGDSYWRTHYRIERDSLVLCPHDFPIKTWWYGYHESLGTLRSFRQGAIHPYTERRLLAFIEWACRRWPVDRDRILVTGCRGGASGSGALHLGLRHPEVFCLAISGHGMLSYEPAARATDRRQQGTAQSLQRIWGQVDWDCPGADGKPFWPRTDVVKLVASTPPGAKLPFITHTSGRSAGHPLYAALMKAHRPFISYWAWGGTRYLPVSRTGTYPNAIHLPIAQDLPVLAFARPGGMEGLGDRALNGGYRWRDIKDRPRRFEATLTGDGTTDLGLRRTQTFRITQGAAYAWKSETTDRKGGPVVQNGKGKAAADGLLVIPGLKIHGKAKLTIERQ